MKKLTFIALLLSSPALAEAPAASAASPLAGFLPIILIVAIFYLLIIRPQSKRFKEHKALIAAMQKGDAVVTGGGIHGKITKLNDDVTVMVEIAAGVEVMVERSTITSVKSKDAKVSVAVASEQTSASSARKTKKAANDNR